ncbi:MAG: hypothetical protein FJ130_02960 [Deltaproteobacteria bacterium]|nr:hypothetical protein [Deltaproteobacteria bacterium]
MLRSAPFFFLNFFFLEKMLSPEVIKDLGLSGTNIRGAIDNAVINLPVGIAAQDAAICAIWVLGNRHEVLKPVAIQALTSLLSFKPEVAGPYLEDLKLKYKGKLLATSDKKGNA